MSPTWPSIVVLDPDPDRCRRWEMTARTMGMAYRSLATISPRRECHRSVRVVILAPARPMEAVIREAHAAFPCARVIVSGIDSDQTSAVEAFRSGADDFVCPGADDVERTALLTRHLAPTEAEAADPT